MLKPDLSHISDPLRRFAVPTDSLIQDPRNARVHPDRNIHAIRQSLQQFGQQRPIILHADGHTVIAGNGTLIAARLLGWTHIAATPSALDGGAARAFGLADNRTAESAEWDVELISDILGDLQAENFPLDSLGWSAPEIDALMSSLELDSDDETPSPRASETPREGFHQTPAAASAPAAEGAGTAAVTAPPPPPIGEPVAVVATGDRAKEWAESGMPEFKHEDKTAFRDIIVHFPDEAAVIRFAALVGQQISPAAKYIWYPEATLNRTAQQRYVSAESYVSVES